MARSGAAGARKLGLIRTRIPCSIGRMPIPSSSAGTRAASVRAS